MEVQRIDGGVEDSVILDQSARFQVEDLDATILLSNRDDVVVTVPAQLIAEALLVLERVDQLSSLGIVNLQRPVLSARSDHFVVGRETSAADPVSVAGVGVHEVAVGKSEHFDGLVVARCNQPVSAVREVDGPDVVLVSNDLLCVAFVHDRLEDINHLVFSHRSEQVLRRPVDVINFVVLLKLQTSQVFVLQRVDRDRFVRRRCRKLTATWIEGE